MSRDWTPEELAQASAAMKAAGYLSYEEFCEAMEKGAFYFNPPPAVSKDEGKNRSLTGQYEV